MGIMRDRLLNSISVAAIAAAAVGILVAASDQVPTSATFKTPWGDPDLQGIWTDETTTPLQRSAKYADQEFFTAAQRT